MATNLTTSKIKDTYSQLLHLDGGPEATEKPVYSGVGTATALNVGTDSASVDNIRLNGNIVSTIDVNGDLNLTPNGTGSVVVSKLAASAGTAVLSSVLSTGALGFTTGGGGVVSQLTSRATGVTLNKPSGAITLFTAAIPASTTQTFTLTNSTIAAADVVAVCIKSGATVAGYAAHVVAVAAGSCSIAISNLALGATPSETPVINFVVIKGATA